MKFLALLSLTFMYCVIHAQENLQLIREVVAEGRTFTTDRLGNFYVANGPLLTKFNRDGQPAGDFRSVFPGNIFIVDASNPLHILLFYKDFNQAVFLDRNLTEKDRTVIFSEFGIDNSELVCASSKGGMWILDWMKRELVYLDNNSRLVFRKPLPVGIIQANSNPAFMSEYEGHLYISFPGTGILKFDLMGNYMSLHPVEVAGAFQVIRNAFLFVSENKAKLYSVNTFNTRILDTKINEKINTVHKERNLLFLFTGQKVFIFRVI